MKNNLFFFKSFINNHLKFLNLLFIMDNLPSEIISIFFKYLDYLDKTRYYLSLNKNFNYNREFIEGLEKEIKTKYLKIIRIFDVSIIKIMSGLPESSREIQYHTGIQNLMIFPILVWKNKYLGSSTDYIESLNFKKEDLTSKIMWGQDKYQRAYILFRTYGHIYYGGPIANVLFQRYGNDKKTWAASEHVFKINIYFLRNGRIYYPCAISLPYNIAQIIDNDTKCKFKYLKDDNYYYQVKLYKNGKCPYLPMEDIDLDYYNEIIFLHKETVSLKYINKIPIL